MQEQLQLLPDLLAAHLQLSLVALLLGLCISIPLGVLLTRRRSWEPAILGVAGVIQTIPSLALLAFMVPALGALSGVTETWFGLEVSAIGYGPALIALTLYSMLPILQNTLTGVLGVDEALKEAARGVGMTDRQQLWQVELPQALPVIVAGVRTATVWVVGTTTLSTPIGAPSLGNYIFTGLNTRNFTAVTVGCIASAGLAIGLDILIRFAQRAVEVRHRGRIRVALALTALLYGYTAWTFVQDQLLPGRAPVVKVGSKAFTEAYIMAEIISARVEAVTPYRATQTKSLGSAVIFEALKSGDLHAYLDFSGTIWVNVMKRGEPPKVRDAILGEVKSALAEEHDVLMLGALGYENLYAFAMRRAQAESLNIRTVSDMIRHAPTLEMAADFEFFGRPEWKSVQAKYGLSFRKRRTMDSALMYAALAEGDVDVISAYTTDGRIDAYDLVVLEDDRGAIPPYHGIVLLNGAFAREHPQVVEALKPMLGAFDETSVRKLNAQVDQDKRSPREVGQAAAKELFK
ncbi:MAG: ABC transporter permease/substrate-binding protein [Myxococcota bacterium]